MLTKNVMCHFRARNRHSHLMVVAEHRCSQLMDNYACEKTSAIRAEEKTLIYIYNINIYVFVVIKADLSQQQPLKWLKMNYIKTMRQLCWKKTIEPSEKILTPSQINYKCHQSLTIKTIRKWFSGVCFGTYSIRIYWFEQATNRRWPITSRD